MEYYISMLYWWVFSFDSGLWNDKSCDNQLNVICKMDKIPVNQATEQIEGCEDGWIGYEGSCYFIDLTRMVWINAENYCK